MRVVSQSYLYNGSSTTFTACDNSAVVGATEDYTLNISSATSTSYLWSTGDTTANINVSPLQTTNYWVDVNGCKDTITVTVLDTTVDLINITACDSYTWIDGNTYTASTATIASTYYVNAGNFYYNPSVLTINQGDTVVWINDGGYHNVNFITSSTTGTSYNNPVSFMTQPTYLLIWVVMFLMCLAHTFTTVQLELMQQME